MTNIDFAALLLSFDGRINRAQYWLATAVYLVIAGVAIAILFTMASGLIAFILAGLLSLAAIVSGVAVGIKRLHDCGKSGWWLLLFYLGPGLLSVAGVAGGAIAEPALGDLASLAIALWGITELGFRRGSAGPNRFGADPLAAQGWKR